MLGFLRIWQGDALAQSDARPESERTHYSDREDRRGLMQSLDASQCLIWYNPEGRVLEANQNARALLGIRDADMDDLTFEDLIGHDAGNPRYRRSLWAKIAAGGLQAEERELVARNHKIWASVTYAALKTPTGETRRVFALIIDLTPWSAQPKGIFAK
ncbi:MAG: PAS domain-containing protein [Pseudomonadota bacterium]